MIRGALTFALAGAATLVAVGHFAREWSPARDASESPAVRTVEVDWSAEPAPVAAAEPLAPEAVSTGREPAIEPSPPAVPESFEPEPESEARAGAAPGPPEPASPDSTELVRRMLHLYRRHIGGE